MMNEDDLPIVVFPQTVGNVHCFGMMLRDYFAAKAMQVLFANPESTMQADAENAYKMANAMLEARK